MLFIFQNTIEELLYQNALNNILYPAIPQLNEYF